MAISQVHKEGDTKTEKADKGAYLGHSKVNKTRFVWGPRIQVWRKKTKNKKRTENRPVLVRLWTATVHQTGET